MRPISVSPLTRQAKQDRYEKLARYANPHGAPSLKQRVEKAKTAWMGQSARSRYVKTGGILLFIVFLFYYLAPKSEHPGPDFKGGNVGGATAFSMDWPNADSDNDLGSTTIPNLPKPPLGAGAAAPAVSVPAVVPVVPIVPDAGGQVASDPTTGTKKCQKSSSSTKPIVQYVIMIDAGSTGSRIHVYRFNNCGSTPELENEDFKMTPKAAGGLSAYGSDAEGAAQSLDVLMEVAMESVPEKLKGCTPVAVKATAGLRKLGSEKSEAILKAVRHRLETKYPFPVVSDEEKGVVVMDGSEEGVFAWITTNYLLGKIGGPDDTPTAATFDLGGGSTQIVFEPTFKSPSHGMPEKLATGDHKYDLDFGGRHFELYQHSHLGYGLMAARNSIHKSIVDGLHKAHPSDQSWLNAPIVNPCIAPGMNRTIKVEMDEGHALGDEVEVQMVGPAEPSAAICRGLAEKILVKDAECKLAPCSFNGIHQPSLAKTFSREDVYIFSFFYDRTFPLGMPESYTLRELQELAGQVCQGKKGWSAFSAMPEAIEELEGRPEWCLDLSFMMALLHTGYEMPMDREVKMAKKIKGNELGWCLGAS